MIFEFQTPDHENQVRGGLNNARVNLEETMTHVFTVKLVLLGFVRSNFGLTIIISHTDKTVFHIHNTLQ